VLGQVTDHRGRVVEARLKQGFAVSVPSLLTPGIFPEGRVGAPIANLCEA
jgi:hypothetical protein